MRYKMAKAKPFKYTRRGRPSKADIEARKKAERLEAYRMFGSIGLFCLIVLVLVFSASNLR
tara:strand:- start:1509 stop:1691 length:183 start_codon:yes stop_codon:yes gene_type:complete